MATRRPNGVKTTAKAESESEPTIPSPAQSAAMQPSFLPTSTELLLLAIFPATLVIGSIYSAINNALVIPYSTPPSQGVAKYSPEHQSYQPASAAPSYFATKSNVFNVYFVKIGWFWITLSLAAFTVLAARGRRAIDIGLSGLSWTSKHIRELDETSQRLERDDRLRRLYQVALRYVAITSFWVFLTQWFFGASIIDRFFRVTGGVCRLATREKIVADSEIQADLAGAVSAVACKTAGGRWSGGFDISGHVFLLTLGTGMLLLEILPVVLPGVRGLGSHRVIQIEGGQTVRLHETHEMAGAYEQQRSSSEEDQGLYGQLKQYATFLPVLVAGLSWWMLLMTSAFFHTWVEKGGALVLSAAALWSVYFLPRSVPVLRGIIGLPAA